MPVSMLNGWREDMIDHDLRPFASPEELEIETKKLELSRLSEKLAQKELDLEERGSRFGSSTGVTFVQLERSTLSSTICWHS